MDIPTEAVRKVAFYDDKFGTWPRSRTYNESNKYYETTVAYVFRGSQKTMMYDIDNLGRGIEIQPQTSVTIGLIFKKKFDLPMPNMLSSGMLRPNP